MCGIYGYIGQLDAYNEVYNGLNMLQYRGYDSCGIAYYNKSKFDINKAVGVLNELKKPDIETHIAFGHTRWATNGEVNLQNTHPHVSFDKEFTIVHNGIITNANIIKNELQKNKIKFYSATDTEVIANVLACFKGNILDKLQSVYDICKGSFSLIIGCKNGDIYLLKRFSPLNILKSKDGIYISSDVSSLKEGELYSLEDGDIIRISNGEITSLLDNEIKFSFHHNTIKSFKLGKYKHYMLKEIYETPESIMNTYKYISTKDIRKIFKHINKITLIGCGTAYNSCLIGEQLMKDNLHLDIDSHLASNYTISKKINRRHLHIIISQSGETADCIKVAEQVKQNSGKLLIITNEESSTITKYADYILATKAGKELAVASTKTYCCQLFVFAYICMILKNKNYSIDICSLKLELENFIEKINIKPLVKKLIDKDKLIMIGKDIDYLTLIEASLKIREIDYVYTIPMYSGELKHGTLSLIDKDSIVLSLNTDDNLYRLDTAKNEINSRGGEVIEISKFFPKMNIEKCFRPILSIIPFQLLSYYIAVERGRNPDMPRNLAKSVTVE